MEIKNTPYLPRNKVDYVFNSFKNRVAYKAWLRYIIKYGGFNRKSIFTILEAGSGAGYFLKCIEKWFPKSKIYGLDADELLVEFSKRHLEKSVVLPCNIETLPFPEQKIDIVCSFQVIEHLDNPLKFLSEAYRVLKTKGFLLLATPNPTGICAKVLKNKWQGYRYDHISLKSPREWRQIIRETGFQILDDGTTAFSGFKVLQKFPFALINWIPMAIFGYFPWHKGESYMLIAKKYIKNG